MFFQTPRSKQLKLTLRPTRYCAYGCAHCFVPEAARNNPELMSEKTFSDLCIFLKKYIEASGIEFVSLLWLGGEPMNIPKSWYEMTDKYLKTLPVPYIEEMQTSALAYTADWDSFIQSRLRNNMILSLDLDTRKYCGSVSGYLEFWKQVYDKLRSIDCTILAILTASNTILEAGASDFLDKLNFLGLDSKTTLNLRKLRSTNHSSEFMTNTRYSQFLGSLFLETMRRFEKGETVPNLEPITIALRGILRNQTEEAVSIGNMHCCLYLPRFTVDSNGELSQCTVYGVSEYATIYDDPTKLFELPKHQNLQKIFSAYAIKMMAKCRSCSYSSWCFSRCFMPSIPDGIEDSECFGFQQFIDCVHNFCETEHGKETASKYLNYCGLAKNTHKYYEDHLDLIKSL